MKWDYHRARRAGPLGNKSIMLEGVDFSGGDCMNTCCQHFFLLSLHWTEPL